jgi:hypothetical protein
MNKKVLVFAVALIIVVMLATPVMAEPAQKIPVTAELYDKIRGDPEKIWRTNGGTTHVQGAVTTGKIRLTIDGQDPLEGTYWYSNSYVVNTKWALAAQHMHKWVLSFEGGSFEGQKTRFSTFEPGTGGKVVWTIKQHTVLQGSGVFKGWTLKLSMDWVQGDPLPRIYTGFLLIPNGLDLGL